MSVTVGQPRTVGAYSAHLVFVAVCLKRKKWAEMKPLLLVSDSKHKDQATDTHTERGIRRILDTQNRCVKYMMRIKMCYTYNINVMFVK